MARGRMYDRQPERRMIRTSSASSGSVHPTTVRGMHPRAHARPPNLKGPGEVDFVSSTSYAAQRHDEQPGS